MALGQRYRAIRRDHDLRKGLGFPCIHYENNNPVVYIGLQKRTV